MTHIHPAWLIVAFYVGLIAGVAVISFCKIAGDADQKMENIKEGTP